MGATDRTPVRVLVVDDTPALRALTRAVLDGTGFEVVGEAGDGLAGVNLASELQPDLVLLDLAMPVMDGLEALPRMREVAPGARVVIVSGFERRAMESQVVEAGADAYLQKGLPPDAMVEALHTLFPQAVVEAPAVPAPRQAPPADRSDDARVKRLESDLEELLYVVSHDLSEPVHVVKGFAERLARRVRTDEEGEFCEFIVGAADRMQQLLDDLLAYARAGQGELPQELVDPRRVVDSVLAGLSGSTSRAGGMVTVGDLPRSVVVCRLVLTQVLTNFVVNALKFVRPGIAPQVHVDAVVEDGRAVFRVADNGIGVDPAQADRVFQPFTRLNSRDAYPGSGVGLAICRRLAERAGGSVWVESREDGATFCLELPT